MDGSGRQGELRLRDEFDRSGPNGERRISSLLVFLCLSHQIHQLCLIFWINENNSIILCKMSQHLLNVSREQNHVGMMIVGPCDVSTC